MNEIIGVDFLQGDLSDPNVLKKLIRMVGDKVNVILSDMSSNITGIASVDVSKSMYLGRQALNICDRILMFGGSFVVKIFQGEGFNEYFKDVCIAFNTVRVRKPIASHIHSREVYIIAKGYNI